MKKVKAKKNLGQHFLEDLSAAERIVNGLTEGGEYSILMEIGPGMGVLTQFLERKNFETHLLEIDGESVAYLKEHFKNFPEERIHQVDFLRFPLEKITQGKPFGIVGNFPYNISSQIFFKVLEHKDECLEVVGMLQKEVAERLASKPGNKSYGILSVLLQAYYEIEYLFSLGPEVFNPPPKVNSGVIRLKRKIGQELDCDPKRFKMIVKLGFNQRRKTLRNALKSVNLPNHPLLDLRAEALSVEDFVELANLNSI